MALTLKRCREIRKQLENIDREIDGIIQEYYAAAGAQNIGGNIGPISRMHADLVQQLSDEMRELEKKDKNQKKT